MAVGKPISAAQLERVLEYLRLGHTVKEAADAIECHPTSLYRILPTEYREEYAAAVEAGKLAQADRSRTLTWKYADSGEWKAADKLGNAYVPEFKPDAQKVEISGKDGSPLQIEDRSASLEAVARILQGVGALGGIPTPPRALEEGDAATD